VDPLKKGPLQFGQSEPKLVHENDEINTNIPIIFSVDLFI
jgi:hypothetical protein